MLFSLTAAPLIETRYYLAWVGQKFPSVKAVRSVVLMVSLVLNSVSFCGLKIDETGLYGYLHLLLTIVFYYFFVSMHNNVGIICKANPVAYFYHLSVSLAMFILLALLVFTPFIRSVDRTSGNFELYSPGNYVDTILFPIFKVKDYS